MALYKLLIVDDEPDVTDGLFNLFKNDDSIELDIYKAYTAYEALDILKRVKIDILITDIFMPGMTGLQLADVVKSRWPHCRIIFLTGYNEFDYIYSAIQYEGAVYILKTESFEKITGAVENAIAQIESNIRTSELEYRANESMKALLPYLQNEYINSILAEGSATAEVRRQQFMELNIRLDGDLPVLLVIGRFNNKNEGLSLFEKTKQVYMVKEIAEEYFPPTLINSLFIATERYTIMWLIQPNTSLSETHAGIVRDCVETIQNICMESFGLAVSFVIDNEMVSWDDLPSRYGSLKLLFHSYVVTGSEMLLLERQKVLSTDTYRDSVIDLRKLKILEEYLESGQKEEFFALYTDLSEQLRVSGSKHYNPSLEVFLSVSLMFLSYINRYNLTEKAANEISLNKLIKIEEHQSWEDASEYFRQLAEVLFKMRGDTGENSAAAAIQQVREYICEHLNEDLSLARLAEKVYFNASYLSRIFKQITGTNLTSYINEARLEKARELLKNNEMKIHEIAAAVGYESASYFTQFFKRFQKISPQEYRDKYLAITGKEK